MCLMCLSLDHFGHPHKRLKETAADLRNAMDSTAKIWAAREVEVRKAANVATVILGEIKGNADMARDAARQFFGEVRQRPEIFFV